MELNPALETEPHLVANSNSNSSPASSSSSTAPSLDDLMKLLRGKTDSQRLAGFLLVTKLCDKNDDQIIVTVYNALGSTFLRRLLLAGMGKSSGGGDNANREAYLPLAVSVLSTLVTVLSTLVRVPEIAATEEMVAIVPHFRLFWRSCPKKLIHLS